MLGGSLGSYDGSCNENVTLKLNFALSVLRLFHVGHIAQYRRSVLSLDWREWFRMVKTKNAWSRFRQNRKYENFSSSFGRLCQNIAPKGTCSTINFPHSTNQIIYLWRCRCRCCIVTPCYPTVLHVNSAC